MAPLLQMQGIAYTLGGTPLLAGADLVVERGARIGLVGRNGSGKSTLMKIVAGEIEPDAGTIFRQPDASVRYLPQEPDFSGYARVAEYVEAGLGPADDPHRAMRLLEGFGLDGSKNPATLSGGEARRAALARTLRPVPDILLLDEPTNHLDLPAIEWLEAQLAGLRSAILLVSHDRRFLTNLSRATVWLDRGVTRRLERGFGAFEEWRDKLLEEEDVAAQKLDRKIVAEEHWMRYGVTARRKRNMRRVAELGELRRKKRDARRVESNVSLASSDAGLSGRLVIEAKNIAKDFGGPSIVKDFSLRVLRGDRLGLIGANGAGKTTLVNLLTGALAPQSGVVKLGANVAMASLDQKRMALDPDMTLADTLTGGGSEYVEVAGARKHVVGYMRDFLFKPEQARTPVGKLSGGERARVMLARALAQPSNLLVLDEPTNDLDLETLDLVEDFLANYPGTVIVVSHDRDFLDRVATSVLMAEGNGRWIEYAGGYSDMVAQRGIGVAASVGAAPAPKTVDRPAASRDKTPARKLSFRDKHALETLPREIDALRKKRDTARVKLNDPTLYARDPAAFAKVSELLAGTERELGDAEDRWLELELLREEIEGAVGS